MQLAPVLNGTEYTELYCTPHNLSWWEGVHCYPTLSFSRISIFGPSDLNTDSLPCGMKVQRNKYEVGGR